MGQGRVTVHAPSMQRAISMHAQLSLVQKNELFQEIYVSHWSKKKGQGHSMCLMSIQIRITMQSLMLTAFTAAEKLTFMRSSVVEFLTW